MKKILYLRAEWWLVLFGLIFGGLIIYLAINLDISLLYLLLMCPAVIFFVGLAMILSDVDYCFAFGYRYNYEKETYQVRRLLGWSDTTSSLEWEKKWAKRKRKELFFNEIPKKKYRYYTKEGDTYEV